MLKEHPDGVPEPRRLAQPDAQRWATPSCGRSSCSAACSREEARRAGRASSSQAVSLPDELLRPAAARAERRREAARGHRPRLRGRAGADPVRRAHLVAGRLGAGLPHEPADAAAGRAAHLVRLHLPRPLGRAAPLGHDRRGLPGPRSWRSATRCDVLTPPFHPYTEALLSAVPVRRPGRRSRRPSGWRDQCRAPWTCRPAAAFTRAARARRRHLREQEPPWREGAGDHRIYCHIPLDELARLQARHSSCRGCEGGA